MSQWHAERQRLLMQRSGAVVVNGLLTLGLFLALAALFGRKW